MSETWIQTTEAINKIQGTSGINIIAQFVLIFAIFCLILFYIQNKKGKKQSSLSFTPENNSSVEPINPMEKTVPATENIPINTQTQTEKTFIEEKEILKIQPQTAIENAFENQGLEQIAHTIGVSTNEVKNTGNNLLKVSDEAQRLAQELKSVKTALHEGQALGGQVVSNTQTIQQGISQNR